MRELVASAPAFVRHRLLRGQGRATTLGLFSTAIYAELRTGAVIAILSSDAVALPIGLVLPVPSTVLPLDHHGSDITVDDGLVQVGDLRIVAGAERSTRVAPIGVPRAHHLASSRRALAKVLGRTELDPDWIEHLARASTEAETGAAVDALLGRGPGLTPAGDDALCGVLVGGVLFGRAIGRIRAAVRDALARRARATTSLSRELLLCACDGHAIAETVAFARALCGDSTIDVEHALDGLVNVGHSSGAALAAGIHVASRLGPEVVPSRFAAGPSLVGRTAA